MYLTKQITNHNIEDKPSSYYTIEIPTREGSISQVIEYKTILEDVRIIKFGYCCEERGVVYPIILKNNGIYKQFKINEKCMFELDPERFKNNPAKEKTHNVNITGVKIPVGIDFTFDYVEVV